MEYEKLLQMKEELKYIKSNFVSISREDYNSLLKIIEEDTVCIDSTPEVDFDVADLQSLIDRCLKSYS